MAGVTRADAEAQVRRTIGAYRDRVHEVRNDTDRLPPEGARIVDEYCSFDNDWQDLVQDAVREASFLGGMDDGLLLEYCAVCMELDGALGLDSWRIGRADRIVQDDKGIWEAFWGALQGEFNENPSGKEILIDMGLNFIPFVGQACDARDIAACLKKLVLEKRADEAMIWATLLLTAVGCIPYAGDVVKAGCKAILKGADGIVLEVLRKLDAEDVYRAFKIFKTKFTSCIDDAIAMVSKWIEEAGKSKYGSKINSIFASAGANLRKAADFVKKQIEEFEERVFGKGKLGKVRKQLTTEPFDKTGKLKSNICYKAGEHNYLYETDELGRICKCNADNLHIKNHDGRLRHNPNTPGKQEEDHAGHLIADIFGGSPELDNLVTQSKAVNQKLYRDIERKWQTALEKGEKVTDIKIEILYNGNNVRPTAFKIEYAINGDLVRVPPIYNN